MSDQMIGTSATLTGSPKQIAWAETIRRERLGDLSQTVAQALAVGEQQVAAGQATTEQLTVAMAGIYAAADAAARQTSAAWWIDNRTASGQYLIQLGSRL